MSLVMSVDAYISKLKFFSGDDVDTPDDEDPIARQDAEFVLLTGTLQRLLKDLVSELGPYSND
jgi:DNA recombination-dependent growth factor C